MSSTRVAVIQAAPQVPSFDANVAHALEALRALPTDVAVAVLPELVTSGYVFADADEARSVAIDASHPVFADWSTVARTLDDGAGGVVVGGFAELGDDGNVYNSAALVDGSGVVGVYRKVHLWDREKLVFTPGSERPLVVDTRVGRIGVMICFDMEFPEWTRLAALDGTELLTVPTNWPRTDHAADERVPEIEIAIATSRINRIAIACADRSGNERGVDWNEGSSIIGTDGRIAAAVGAGTGVAIADVDLAATRDKSASELVDLIGDRRPDLYGGLVTGR
jgi:5-aminopentanamidase